MTVSKSLKIIGLGCCKCGTEKIISSSLKDILDAIEEGWSGAGKWVLYCPKCSEKLKQTPNKHEQPPADWLTTLGTIAEAFAICRELGEMTEIAESGREVDYEPI